MKLTAIILLAFALHVGAKGVSQTVTFSGKKINLQKVFSVIEAQTGFVVFYEDQLLEGRPPVTIELKNCPLKVFLKEALKDQSLDFDIKGKTVFISRLVTPAVPPDTKDEEPPVPPIDVTGRITNENGEPVVATVVVKSTGKATTTNANGEFTLKGIDENAVLVISGVNIEQREIKATAGVMNISVKNAVSALLETVVIGYGREKKVNVIGSVATVSGTELSKAPVISISNAMAGRLPGTIVSQRTGEPGFDGASILIRGKGTLGNNSPLIVIDGVQGRDLNSLNVNDVESISILKDASAAIYGARAANGVILVTTKRGKEGPPTVTYEFYQGLLSPTRLPKMADAATYAQMIREMQTYAGTDEVNMLYTPEDIEKYRSGKFPWTHPNTNWWDEVLKDFSQNRNHNLTINGGSQSVNYYLSFGTQWADAIYKNSPHRYNRYNLKGNVDVKLNKYLTVNLDINGIQEKKLTAGGDRFTEDYTDESLIFNVVNQGRPNTFNKFPNGLTGTGSFGADYQPALLATAASGFNDKTTNRLNTIISANLKVPFVEGLSMSTYYAYDLTLKKRKWFHTPMTAYFLDKAAYLAAGNTGAEDGSAFLVKTVNNAQPNLEDLSNDFKVKTFNFRINYDKSINKVHNFNAFVAYEQSDEFFEEFGATRNYFVSAQLPYLFAGGDAEKDNFANVNLDARVNYFGRISYNYKETYLVQFSLRRDGSLRFSKESGRWGNFPSILAGWRISNEKFWQEHLGFINAFKLKASWGQLGNDRVEPFQYLATYQFTSGGVYGSDRLYKQSLVQNFTPNPFITWEVSNAYNVGFESQFFNNKVYFNTDFFYQRRKDILVARNASVPDFTGISLPDENYGIVDNRGFELELGYNGRAGRDITYSISGFYAFARNKIIEFDEPAQSVPWQVRTGHPQNGFLLYDGIGIFRDQAEIDKTPHVASAIPGDVVIRDVDGDGEITTDDRILFDKTTDPEYTYGISFSFNYKNFQFSGLVSGAGNAMYQMLGSQQGTPGNYYSYYADGRWTPDNIDADKPRAYQGYTPYWRNSHRTDMEFQQMDYARMKNLQLSYNLPDRLIKKVLLKDAQVYLSGQNLFLIYNGKGIWDGEFGGDRDNYPLMRVYAAGVRLTF
ncbi:MAG: TonB-dependent receptor [Chitinophagaceae bacterium]|nr:TonB-dependent receptor [Chitinophagaceae bacterium]